MTEEQKYLTIQIPVRPETELTCKGYIVLEYLVHKNCLVEAYGKLVYGDGTDLKLSETPWP